MVKSSGFASIC